MHCEKRIGSYGAFLAFCALLSGCAAPLIAYIPTVLTAGGAVAVASDELSADPSQMLSSERILEKRAFQTRKFAEKDEKKILSTLTNTLVSMGFTNTDFNQSLRIGYATGPKYSLNWTLRNENGQIYMRVAMTRTKAKAFKFNWSQASNVSHTEATKDDYTDFWNSLGQVAFLRTLEVAPKDL